MAIRPFTLTTAAGLGLLFALQADAGQANVSLATGSAATYGNDGLRDGGGHLSRRFDVLEAQTPPPAAAAPAPAPGRRPPR